MTSREYNQPAWEAYCPYRRSSYIPIGLLGDTRSTGRSSVGATKLVITTYARFPGKAPDPIILMLISRRTRPVPEKR